MEFEYKEVDKDGLSILDAISTAGKFNKWLYETISPFCEGKIIEIGSGVGNISQFFIGENKSICLSDIRENYREILKNRFGLDNDRVIEMDIVAEDFMQKYHAFAGTFDSVFCLNVVEHIRNDHEAIENMMGLLKPGGKLTVLVPSYQFLYNGFDKTLGHYRRYNKTMILRLMNQHGDLNKVFYFNLIGIMGWFVSGLLSKNKTISTGEMKLYDFFVPLIRLVDRMIFNKIGLSVICVISKRR